MPAPGGSADAPPRAANNLFPALQHALTTAGITVGFIHTFEVISGDSSSVRPMLGGLSDFDIRWKPRRHGALRNGTLTVKYSVYLQNRQVEAIALPEISSNLAESFHHCREVYFKLPLSRFLRVKLGKVDANTEFAVIESGADFSNASIGVSPTLFTMPSYPDGGASANAFVTPANWLSVAGGIYRTQAGARYSVVEGGVRWEWRRPGRVAVGYWNQTAEPLPMDGAPKTSGAYIIAEQTILPLGLDKGLRAFARFSTADEWTAPAQTHTAYGVTWTGFWSRATDSTGFAVLDVLPSRTGQIARPERTFELYYRISVSRHFAVKMDIQQFRQPGEPANDRPVSVGSIRFLINLSSRDE